MPQADQGSADCSILAVVVHVAVDIWLVVDKLQDIALENNR